MHLAQTEDRICHCWSNEHFPCEASRTGTFLVVMASARLTSSYFSMHDLKRFTKMNQVQGGEDLPWECILNYTPKAGASNNTLDTGFLVLFFFNLRYIKIERQSLNKKRLRSRSLKHYLVSHYFSFLISPDSVSLSGILILVCLYKQQ